ncbi:MAG: lysophospholipid acyltransferase family protein [Acidobacteriaceae bacterium]
MPNPATPKLRFAQRLAIAIVPPLAALLIRLLGLTLRYQDRADPGVTPGHLIPGASVFAFWHRSMIACAHRFRNLGIAILISPSFDGELIARTLKLLGFLPVRGSSSRGGAAGLLGLQQAYAQGHCCAITADGPRGPIFVAKPGTALLANSVSSPLTGNPSSASQPAASQPAGTWVGCFYALPDRAWQLRSWDRFLIPKPFSRVVITWPAHVPSGQVTTASVQAALDRAVHMAEKEVCTSPRFEGAGL